MAKTKSDESSTSSTEQPFISHLVEMRDRLIRVVILVLLIFAGLFSFANDLYMMLSEPLLAHMPKGGTMIAIDPISPFIAPFKLALVTAIFISIPFILYQAWAFIAPGLYQNEKKLALPLLTSSIILFYAGMAFAYFIVFPLVFNFIIGYAPTSVAVMTDISSYLNFVLKMFFAFGFAFEIPIATIILVATGMTTPESLASKRPYIVVGVFTLAMLITPPDVISQTLLALPMLLLFEAGLYFSKVIVRNRKKEEDDDGDDETEDEASTAKENEKASTSYSASSSTMTALPNDEYRELTDEEMDDELDRAIAEEEALQGESDLVDDSESQDLKDDTKDKDEKK